MLSKAQDQLKEFGDEFVSIEHIILAMLDVKDQASTLLKDSGINSKDLKQAILELRKGEKVTSQNAEETYNALNKYAVNLNEQAKNGKLDPVIGRDEENPQSTADIVSQNKKQPHTHRRTRGWVRPSLPRALLTGS